MYKDVYLGAVIPCYRLTYYLPLVLKSLYVNEIVVLSAGKVWDGENDCTDNTYEICAEFPRVKFIEGSWNTQADQRNEGIRRLQHCHYIFMLDSDEILLPEDQYSLIQFAKKHPEGDTYGCLIRNYFGGFSYVTGMNIDHRPVVLVKPSARLREIRNTTGKHLSTDNIILHHLKFLQPKEDVLWRCGHKGDLRDLRGIHKIDEAKDIKEYLKNNNVVIPKDLVTINDVGQV